LGDFLLAIPARTPDDVGVQACGVNGMAALADYDLFVLSFNLINGIVSPSKNQYQFTTKASEMC
jgi:hypothetical protein